EGRHAVSWILGVVERPQDLLRARDPEMLEERFLQGSRPSAPVGRAQDAADGVFPDPEARALVPQVPAPSSGSRDPARGVAAPGDRACAADESEPDTSLRPRDERDPRVVGHDDAVLEADAPEDFP